MRGCPPGAPRSEDRRWRGFQPSTGAAALNAGFIPDDKAPALVISTEPALATHTLVHDNAHASSSASPRPGPLRRQPYSGVGTAHRPRQVSKTEEISPATMQRDTENTLKTQRKHQSIARFLEDTWAIDTLIPSVLDTPGPTTPDNRPRQHATPPETTAPPENDTQKPTNKPPCFLVLKGRDGADVAFRWSCCSWLVCGGVGAMVVVVGVSGYGPRPDPRESHGHRHSRTSDRHRHGGL